MQVLKLDMRPDDYKEEYRRNYITLGILDELDKSYKANLFKLSPINDVLKGNFFSIICGIRDEFTDVHPKYYLQYTYSNQKWGIYIKNKDYSARFYENDGVW